MSEFSIKQYLNELEKIIHYGGSNKETSIRNAFYNLLNEYAKGKGLMVVPEIEIKATNSNKKVRPDGTLKDSLRQDWGYWESKDESDDIDEEIQKKFSKGYPKENILFEDSQTSILIQNGVEVLRVSMKDAEALHRIISAFINFERPEVQHFRKAIELFKQDIPKVTDTLRELIIIQENNNSQFIKAREIFLKLCHDSINPNITQEDIREMMIQHILTEDVFNTIFDENQFHRENNIAHELESVIHTFFTGATRKTALGSIQHYYQAINAAAAGIADHHEKQKFLKVIYEAFYKSYNPKAADRLGVVYTPNEIVQFMIKSTDYLLNFHFGKYLEDKGVEILDPATGTGTFICDMIDYMSKDKLEYKYKSEIHANEVAILPYYISNLNIEFTYAQKMGKYAEFENLCFVDTLDNMAFSYRGKQIDMFSPFTEENTKRIKNQNDKKIAVIIGNPPYNANQISANDDNRNREYPIIDKRIKDTFIANSTAQKTKVYDMYARFYRWAFDRIDNRGVIAFITNNSFINSRTFDGFRKCIQDEFHFAYIIDLGGNIRELSGKDGIFLNENNTIFGVSAAVGIAIMFLIKDTSKKNKKCIIKYVHPTDIRATREEKIAFLMENKIEEFPFMHIFPDKENNWINQGEDEFELFLPLNNRNSDSDKNQIFRKSALGISTNRDGWVYDLDPENLKNKMIYFIDEINRYVPYYKNKSEFVNNIKWTTDLKRKVTKLTTKLAYSERENTIVSYRPFINLTFFANKITADRLTENHYLIKGQKFDKENKIIHFTDANSEKPFMCLVSNQISDLHFVGSGAGTINISRYIYNTDNERIDNITDWGLNKFIKHYKLKKISKDDIFHYVYAIMHDLTYRKKYELNLKRSFPRIPFYPDFKKWVSYGKSLMDLHLNYKEVTQFGLIIETTNKKASPSIKLKAERENGVIVIDENTSLTGVPIGAWEYKLGHRSALDWILDQYKESKSKDSTILEKFQTYKFSDYKDEVIDLIKRVCTVSIETLKIVEKMGEANNSL